MYRRNRTKFVLGTCVALALAAGLLIGPKDAKAYFYGADRFSKGDPVMSDLVTWSKGVIVDKDTQSDFSAFVAAKIKSGEFNVKGPEDYELTMIRFLMYRINELNDKINSTQGNTKE